VKEKTRTSGSRLLLLICAPLDVTTGRCVTVALVSGWKCGLGESGDVEAMPGMGWGEVLVCGWGATGAAAKAGDLEDRGEEVGAFEVHGVAGEPGGDPGERLLNAARFEALDSTESWSVTACCIWPCCRRFYRMRRCG
jgi:hypothetical protein